MADLDLLPVTELRQWAYCPRVVYYHVTMPGAGRSTYKMQEGLRAQELIENLEMRRTLREYLKGHPNVANVTEPPHNQGGQGATEVELRQ